MGTAIMCFFHQRSKYYLVNHNLKFVVLVSVAHVSFSEGVLYVSWK